MPRRKNPPAFKGQFVFTDASIDDLRLAREVVGMYPETSHLAHGAQEQLAQAIFLALSGARQGMRPFLTGRKYKFDPLALDILCASVGDAWRRVGLTPTAWETDSGRSSFVHFLHVLTGRAGLKGARETLLNNVNRGKEMGVN